MGVESSAPGVYALPPTPFYFGGVDRLGPFNSVTVDLETYGTTWAAGLGLI